jgi:hypothetical protein
VVWYHLHQREEVALVDTVDTVDTVEAVPEPIDKTVKVTESNRKRLTALTGELTSHDGEYHSHNDAINYLFDNQKGKPK